MNRYAVVAEKAWAYSEERRKINPLNHEAGVKGKANSPLGVPVFLPPKARRGVSR